MWDWPVYGWINLVDKVKRYYAFSANELIGLAAAIFSMAFILSFRDISSSIDPLLWVKTLLPAILIMALALIVHLSAQRIYSLEQGFKAEFTPWFIGIILGVLIAIMSYGYVILLLPGGIVMHLLETHRVGYFRYRLGYWTQGFTALTGPLASMLLAFFFEVMSFLPSPLIHQAVIANVLLAVCSMLPFPPLDGSRVLIAAQGLYFFSFGAIASAGLFLIFAKVGIIFSILGGIVVGTASLLLYNHVLKKFF